MPSRTSFPIFSISLQRILLFDKRPKCKPQNHRKRACLTQNPTPCDAELGIYTKKSTTLPPSNPSFHIVVIIAGCGIAWEVPGTQEQGLLAMSRQALQARPAAVVGVHNNRPGETVVTVAPGKQDMERQLVARDSHIPDCRSAWVSPDRTHGRQALAASPGSQPIRAAWAAGFRHRALLALEARAWAAGSWDRTAA